MSADTPAADATEPRGDTRLALLLAMAMFVRVVDGFGMIRLPDPKPSGAAGGTVLG